MHIFKKINNDERDDKFLINGVRMAEETDGFSPLCIIREVARTLYRWDEKERSRYEGGTGWKRRKKRKEKKGNRGNFSIHLGTPPPTSSRHLVPSIFHSISRLSLLPASSLSIKMLMLNFNGIRLFRISREMMVEKLEGNFAKVYFIEWLVAGPLFLEW